MVQRKLPKALHQQRRRRTQRIYDSCKEHLVDSKHVLSLPYNVSASSDGDHRFLLLEVWILFTIPWVREVSHMVGSEPGLKNHNIWRVLVPDFSIVMYAIFVLSGFHLVTSKQSHWCKLYPLPPISPSIKHLFPRIFHLPLLLTFEEYYSDKSNKSHGES